MKRAYLTPRQKYDLLRRQGWRCACGCGAPVWPGGPVEYDHTLPLALGGPEKPDRALTPHCHREKTRKDVAQIAKAKRLANGGRKRKGYPIPKHVSPWPPRGSRKLASRKMGAGR